MRHFFVLLIFFLAFDASAALSPRMYSIIVQGALTYRQNSESYQNQAHAHKADLNLLYNVRNGPTFGLRYLTESSNDAGRVAGEAYGPSVGYYWERGWFILAHYDLYAQLGQWYKGTGPQTSLGYLEHIGGHFHIGFQVSHRTTVYEKDKTNSQSESRTVKDTYPSLTLMYLL